ncbi:MAG: DUF362 domain-containing protein [Chloroflexota bacterium]|nr:DUF362 domain-containing protein [Chloroflexota bacterium]
MTSPRLSRRAFLRLATLATAGAGVVALDRMVQPIGLARAVPWLVRGQTQKLSSKPAVVGLASCPSYDDTLDCLRDLWRQSAMPDVAGKRVLVKPNLIDHIEGHPATTAPQVVAAVLDLLAELGAARVIVGDGPGFRRDAAPVAEASGLAAVLAHRGISFVDLNYDDPRPVPVGREWFLQQRELWLPLHVREADLIVSVPKLKTHHWAGVSLSLKNLFGVVPGVRYGWPKNMLHVNGIALSILGIFHAVPLVVSVVDGIIGMEGDGPLFGTPVRHGLLAVGADPVAVDGLCAQLMGFDLNDIPHLSLAVLTGIGQPNRIDVVGGSIERLQHPYARPPAW